MRIIICTYFALLTSLLTAQHLPCGVPDEPLESEIARRQIVQNLKNVATFPTLQNEKFVAIKMHLISAEGANAYPDDDNVNQFLANLNRQFQPTGIVFYFSGTDFNYIENAQIFSGNYTSSELTAFENNQKVDNAINFFVPGAIYIDGTPVAGYSSIAPTNQAANDLWATTGRINGWEKTCPHEFGHYFGLPHTFNNSRNSIVSRRELVTRNFNEVQPRVSANCDIAGDYVIDTPSDNHSGSLTEVGGCNYNSTATDLNNDLFVPDVHNYMSYNNCGPYAFTPGQYAKLSDGYLIVTNPSNNFTLDAPEIIQSPPGNFVATMTSNDADYFGSVQLTWTDNSDVETGYIIEIAADPLGPFIPIAGTARNVVSFDDVELLPGVVSYFRIKASNTKSNYSAVASVSFPELCGNSFGQSCELDTSSDIYGAYRIENFQLRKEASGEIVINNSESGCAVGGIGNYYHTLSATVEPGEILSFTMDSKEGLNGFGATMTTAIYVDWNRNSQFETSERMYVSPREFVSNTGSFTIPNNIASGDFRMRVCATAVDEIPGPCVTLAGEAEDYKLTNNTLGVKSDSSGALKLYPNPVSAILYVEMPDASEITQITISDVSGKIISVDKIADNAIDTHILSAGIYFLAIDSESGRHFARFVKN